MIGFELLGPHLGQSMFDGFVGHPENLTPSVREGYWLPVHEGTTCTMRYFAQSKRSLPEHFPRYQVALRKLNVPAMLIWGKRDLALDCEAMTGQFARELNITNEHIHIFEDAKHFLWEDYPDDIARLIASFVK
jgi:pimeloyl-ACP methyl ester carboxylesterase